MKIAVITGASSGLGRECLEQLREESALPVRVFPLDLTKEESLNELRQELRKHKPDVRLLINGAGFGKIGDDREISWEDSLRMVDLNCRAAVALTVMCLPFMRRGGRILQICSTAAFQPFPFLNIYAASKAFLYRYSRGLRREVLRRL